MEVSVFKRPCVDVLLPSYNGSRYIETQVESVLAQTDVDVFLYVFDDCSTDRTRDILSEFELAGKLVVFRRDQPSGGAFESYRNLIAEFVPSNDFVAFCDQDDIWLPNKLITQINAIHASHATGCSASVISFSDDGKGQDHFINNAGQQKKFDFLFEGGGQGCTYLFRTSVFLVLKSVFARTKKSAVPHDWLLYAICRCNDLPWIILEQPLVRYRQHGENSFGSRGSWAGRASRFNRLFSRSFLRQRLDLIELLSSSDLVETRLVPDVLSRKEKSFFSRLYFVFFNALNFRRFRLHSLVIAVFFLFGLA